MFKSVFIIIGIIAVMGLSSCATNNKKGMNMPMKVFAPKPEEQKELEVWFEKFDQYSKKFEYEKMADEGRFPMYVITDKSSGDGVTKTWDRADYLAAMKNAMANTPEDIQYETRRNFFMISPNLAIAFTEWNTLGSENSIHLKYVDFLMKVNGQWKFQSMIQSGWGDFLQ